VADRTPGRRAARPGVPSRRGLGRRARSWRAAVLPASSPRRSWRKSC